MANISTKELAKIGRLFEASLRVDYLNCMDPEWGEAYYKQFEKNMNEFAPGLTTKEIGNLFYYANNVDIDWDDDGSVVELINDDSVLGTKLVLKYLYLRLNNEDLIEEDDLEDSQDEITTYSQGLSADLRGIRGIAACFRRQIKLNQGTIKYIIEANK